MTTDSVALRVTSAAGPYRHDGGAWSGYRHWRRMHAHCAPTGRSECEGRDIGSPLGS